jgi:hypothetical protein
MNLVEKTNYKIETGCGVLDIPVITARLFCWSCRKTLAPQSHPKYGNNCYITARVTASTWDEPRCAPVCARCYVRNPAKAFETIVRTIFYEEGPFTMTIDSSPMQGEAEELIELTLSELETFCETPRRTTRLHREAPAKRTLRLVEMK